MCSKVINSKEKLFIQLTLQRRDSKLIIFLNKKKKKLINSLVNYSNQRLFVKEVKIVSFLVVVLAVEITLSYFLDSFILIIS